MHSMDEICWVIWVVLRIIGFSGANKGLYIIASAFSCFAISFMDDVDDIMGHLKRNDTSHEFRRCLGGTYDRGFFLRPD